MQTAFQLRHNLFVFPDPHNPAFVDEIEADLGLIEQNPVGKRLIEKIAQCRNIIGVKYNPDGMHCNPVDLEGSFLPGKGSSTIVWFCPSRNIKPKISFQCEPLESPRFVDFFHELIHAYHCIRGKTPKSNQCDQIVWSNDREYKVIMGFPSNKPGRKIPKITENAFRIEQRLAPRFSHHGFDDMPENSFVFARIKLVAKACYNNRFSLLEDREIKNLTIGDLQPIGGSIFYSRVFLSKGSAPTSHIIYFPPSQTEESAPSMTNIDDPEKSAHASELKKDHPNLLGIDTIGFYLISQEEADCLLVNEK